MQTSVSLGALLIYGGVGCSRYAAGKDKGFCVAAHVLDDLWQFDAAHLTFRKLELNPNLSPVFGHLFVKVPGGGLGGGWGGAEREIDIRTIN